VESPFCLQQRWGRNGSPPLAPAGVLGYLVVGAVVGPHALGLVGDLPFVEAAATIGVALLMFTLGLEISVKQLRQVGRVGVWGGITQILATFGIGWLVGVTIFQWPVFESILFGLIISLSSTAVCMKILMDRGEMDSVHGSYHASHPYFSGCKRNRDDVRVPFMSGTVQNLPLELAVTVVKLRLLQGWLSYPACGYCPGSWAESAVYAPGSYFCSLFWYCAGYGGCYAGYRSISIFGSFIVGLVLREPSLYTRLWLKLHR